MIRKYQFGTPEYNCEACVLNIHLCKEKLPYFEVTQDDVLRLQFQMSKGTKVYGLGENIRGINKRGYRYVSKCNDDPKHLETTQSLYAAHNFILVDGEKRFGMFIDCPGIVSYDIGYQDIDRMEIECENKDLFIYIIEQETLLDIIQEFRSLIGQSYIPPKWAFGYGQSRWGYRNANDVRKITEAYEHHHIPLDMIYLDIDYMENYKDFTINNEAFPYFEDFVKEMKDCGIRLIPIIDAAVRIEKNYPVYEEGVQHNYFCKDEHGNDFVAGVWPGRCHFPDFLNKEARYWFGEQYRFLLDKGIEGFWNDMNEPSIFYTDTGLNKAFELAETLRYENLNVNSFFQLVNSFSELSNNRKDYELFYHNIDGIRIRHDKIHNQYGYRMTQSAMEAFNRYDNNRKLLFSRASSIGMHRYSGIWTGDNLSWWSHLLLNIKMMPSLQMCGFLYSGADLGGFGENTTQDLMMRWIQFGIFTPLMRNHSACEREQELYQFKNTEDFQHMIEIRYALIPYLYSEFVKAACQNKMYFLPLAFVFEQDPFASQVEDQLMLSDALMITPIYEQNATGRYVYLPEPMMFVRMRSFDDYDVVFMEKGHHYITCELHELPFFIRKNKVIPMAKPCMHTDNMDTSKYYLFGYVEDEAKYCLYDDDGVSKDYLNPNYYKQIHVKKTDTGFRISRDVKVIEKAIFSNDTMTN